MDAVLSILCLGLSAGSLTGVDDPFADAIISYEQGVGAQIGYTTPNVALGAPERFTGERFLPGAVTPFFPAFMPDEVVSIGAGGSLVVAFDTPVTDDPNNPYGLDLLVFGNSGCIDGSYPTGVISGLIGPEGGTIQVSSDGAIWHTIDTVQADGLFPTMGYADEPAYSESPGVQPSVMTRPVDPRLTLDHLLGLDADALAELYRGSGGGAGIDLSTVGLDAVSYVRISVAEDAIASPEIDALADVHPRLPGDVNDDGLVNLIDFTEMIVAWGPSEPGGIPADFDNDEIVGLSDFMMLLVHWSSTP